MTKLIAALMGTAMLAIPAHADTALGLAGDRMLVMVDTASAMVTGTVEVQGVDRLLGIDYRAGNGTVVGVTADQEVVQIDLTSGQATVLSRMDIALPLGDMPVVVDVNPAADRLRLMTGVTNHRVNMDTGEVVVDGELHFDAADSNAGTAPMVVATAYTNSYGKPESTAMFNIDAGLGALLRQTAPNDGTLATIGALGAAPGGAMALDVSTDAAGENTAWLLAGGGLHVIDLETGAIAGSWQITGTDMELRDLTVIPAM